MGDETAGAGRRGRVAKAPEGDDPAAVFARQLWELKQRAGNPSYDVMRRDHGVLASKSALSAAARGARLPSWETTWEFVRSLAVGVLGHDEQQVHAQWRQRWERAASTLRAQAEPSESLPDESGTADPGSADPGGADLTGVGSGDDEGGRAKMRGGSAGSPRAAASWIRRRGWWVLGAAGAIGVLLTALFWLRPERPAPAPVAEPCEATWLCLYRNIGFDDMNFRTQRQNTCWRLADYFLQDAVFSYDNNMPVTGHFYDSAKNRTGDIRAGDSSQDSSALPGAFWFCTGSARP